VTLEVRPVGSSAAWADRSWAAERDAVRVAHLDLDTAGGRFELWLTAEPPDREAGAALLRCLDAHAGRLESIVPARMVAVHELLAAAGFAVEREVWQMARSMAEGQPAPRWPGGIAVRCYERADARAVHGLLELAFAGGAEAVEPFDRWHRLMTGDREFDPACWWLAERRGELAGVALCWRSGWLKDLAVHPDERGRGLGEALCRHVFREFSRRGVGSVGLKVDADNPTGAVRLYRRVGMRVDRVFGMCVRA
jgi:ribosomal protein S18 acetylase RimI-like enzyme